MSIEVNLLGDVDRRPRSVAVGMFDGVHVGHRAVIGDADTVLTFEPHPLSVIHPDAAPKLIMPFDIKRDVIEGLGVRELVVIAFDKDFSGIEAEDFCRRILIDTLQATAVSVGENFRFGRKARGDAAMLQSHSEFTTRIEPLVEVNGETVSSTRVRAAIAAGDLDTANACLGAPFLLEGEVVEGDQRGRTLGFPTANIVPDDTYAVPGHGVYAAFADGRPAAVNVGVRPTFETGRGLLVEAFLIDYEGDLYGRTLRVAFVERLRGEKRFASAEDLIAQMHRDVADASAACESYRAPTPGS